jgi:F0F1-type ATP synthase delta subunit
VTSIFASIARLLGRSSISNEEVLQVLRDHERRIKELEKVLEDRAQEVEDRFNDLSKKSQAAKRQATKQLEQLRSDLDSLIGAVELVIAGELAPARRQEIKSLMKVAKGRRTRIHNIIESRVN